MIIKKSTTLNSDIYKDALQIRLTVFVEEQGIPADLEIDKNENIATNYVLYNSDNNPVGTARIINENGGWHIQRVAVLSDYRHKGIGSKIIKAIEKDAITNNVPFIVLGAQDQAQNFYLNLGYQVVGDGYLDANIPHHDMKKEL